MADTTSVPTSTRSFGTGARVQERDATLSPPLVRQPYTPPPRRIEDGDIEGARDDEIHGLQGSNGDFNSSLDLKTHGVDGVDDLAICASPGAFIGTKKKRKASASAAPATPSQSLAAMLRKGIVDHQLGLSLNLLLLLAMSWSLFPSLRNNLEALFLLSYKSSQADGQGMMYGSGPRDLYFVFGWIVFFTGLRAFMLDCVLTPLAGLWGIRNPRMRTRFAEQGYLLLYYLLYWNLGLYLFVRDTPSPLVSDGSSHGPLSSLLISMWTNFPRLLLKADMKIYYLSQLAFWTQQIIVVHLEEKRKDHYQMLTHHILTVMLVSTSYGYRQCRVGNAVLVCMDIVEIIFPTAKILKYLGLQAACDIAFGMFVLLWLVARHGCYLTICWSIYAHVNEVTMPYGTYSLKTTISDQSSLPSSIAGLRLSSDGGDEAFKHIYQPFVNPFAETVSFNARIRWSFLALLLGLQCITLLWFTMICRVVLKVLRGEGADDTRSDDEDDEDEEVSSQTSPPAQLSSATSIPITAPAEKPRFIEVEADSTDYVRRTPSSSGSSTRRSRKGNTFSSGLHLGEHKEILNRIGCLSEEQLAREREKGRENEGR